VGAACDVGESLVDRDPLDQRREVAEYPDRGVAEPLASTTPPPTAIGFPLRDGSSICSTEA
jgi:hypothetical protein